VSLFADNMDGSPCHIVELTWSSSGKPVAVVPTTTLGSCAITTMRFRRCGDVGFYACAVDPRYNSIPVIKEDLDLSGFVSLHPWFYCPVIIWNQHAVGCVAEPDSAALFLSNVWCDDNGKLTHMSASLLWGLARMYMASRRMPLKKFLPRAVFTGPSRTFRCRTDISWSAYLRTTTVNNHRPCTSKTHRPEYDTTCHPDAHTVFERPVCSTCYTAITTTAPSLWWTLHQIIELFSHDFVTTTILPLCGFNIRNVALGSIAWHVEGRRGSVDAPDLEQLGRTWHARPGFNLIVHWRRDGDALSSMLKVVPISIRRGYIRTATPLLNSQRIPFGMDNPDDVDRFR